MALEKAVRFIKGVGMAKARDFARLGINTLEDALYHFPFRYDDLSAVMDICAVQTGQKVTVRGVISLITNHKSTKQRRMIVTEAIVEDHTGKIKAVWFHQGFLTTVLKVGTVVSLSGKVDDRYGLSLVNPVYEVIGSSGTTKHTGRVVPIYPLAGALTQKLRRMMVEEAMKSIDEVKDWVPADILRREELPDEHHALARMHMPATLDEAKAARKRFAFDEFLLHQLLHRKTREALKRETSPSVPFSEAAVKAAIAELPFALTAAQKKALWAVLKDLERTEPMNRLLEGDVGTGKTLVAAIAGVNAAASSFQTAMLAPTEILADQHAATLERLLPGHLRVALFTRTKRRVMGKEVTKAQMLDALKNGKVDFVVGTHAILSDDVLFDRLGLIVVDEQHRFGVKQRHALKDRQGDADGIPHLLSMTATPIPRSLALVLYGDLDRSLLDEYPAGRKPIQTSIVDLGREDEWYEKMREEMDKGRQVFVVCPLIEESDALGVQSVSEIYNAFVGEIFRAYRIGMLHGKMKTDEKDKTMSAFASGELDMLISTTVVEVGVDVPNATVMFIEGAERFGLAQLHQLRGRVGRGEHQSYCFLHPTGILSGNARERLLAVTRTQNGFILADKDLELRGPGNIFGTDQSGFESFKIGTFADVDLMAHAKDHAKDLFDEDPTLSTWPVLKERLAKYVEETHFE